MKIKIKFFAKAKELSTAESLEIALEHPVPVSEIRRLLIEKLSIGKDAHAVETLINDCALGNSQQILSNQDLISCDQNLVLLPPVCGG